MADTFKQKWFRTSDTDSIPVEQAEEEFWRIVNTCEVSYLDHARTHTHTHTTNQVSMLYVSLAAGMWNVL